MPGLDQQSSNFLATIPGNAFAQTRSASMSSVDLLPAKRSTLSQSSCVSASIGGTCATPSARNAWRSIFAQTARLRVRHGFKWLRMLARARPVCTNDSHAGLGAEEGLVITSTTSPLCTSARSGTVSPLRVAATVVSPTSL